MHEYSVVTELISALLPQLEGHAGRVSTVFLVKGELRILSDTALRHAFELLSQGTRLEEAELVVESVGVRVRCRSCDYVGPAEHVREESFHFAIPILSCPSCGAGVDIEAGRELYVDRVTLQTEATAEAS
jgi:hydrogenase nickel incorporation protein HypA/HybF